MKRSLSLDFFKIFLSFVIVIAHLHPLLGPDDMAGMIWIGGFCRIPVTCFFILNGYFLFSKIDDFTAVRKYLTQIILVYLVWATFYTYFYYDHVSIGTIIRRYIFGHFQLWYMPALITAVPLFYGIRKLIKSDLYILLIILFLYMVGHILDPYMAVREISRNGLFLGLPSVVIDYFLRKYNIKEWFKTWQLVVVVVLGIITLGTEAYLYLSDGRKFSDMYLSAIFLCPAAIMLTLKKPLLISRTTFTNYIGEISTGVYFIHMFFIFKLVRIDYNIYSLPSIFILSVLATIPIIYINKRAKILL